MDNTIDGAGDGASDSDTFFPILTTAAKSAEIRRLSLLGELSFVGGRAGDTLADWRRDIEGALPEAFPKASAARRERLRDRLEAMFVHGTEARLVDLAQPPEAATMLARARAISKAAQLKLRLAGRGALDMDSEIADLAWEVAFETPCSAPQAARAAIDAFAVVTLPGSNIVATAALKGARDGRAQRGGAATEMASIAAEAIATHDGKDPGGAIASAAVEVIERVPSASVAEAVAHALEAADLGGIGAAVTDEGENAATAAAMDAAKARDAADEGDVPATYPANAEPPTWWHDHWEAPDRFDLEREPGLFGELARWSVRYAFRPVPEFAPLVALATLAPIYSRRFVTPTSAGLNLYLIGLAETAGGKEATLGAPPALLDAAKLSFLIGAGDFTSDSAIELALRSRPNFVAPIDEVSEFIGAAQHRNAASHSRTLRRAMLELYSKARPDARWSGKQKVEAENPDKAANPIYAPHLSILGCATVEGFFEALTEGNLTGGFVNRWVVIRGGRPHGYNADPSRVAVPEALSAALANAYASTADGNLADSAARDPFRKPQMRVVPWGGGGEAAWHDVLMAQTQAVEAGRGDIVGRAAENTLKIATIRALARDGIAAAVTERDVLWAWQIVRASIETVEAGARENMAGSDFEALVKMMERYIVQAGRDGIAWSKLIEKRGMGKYKDDMLEAARKRLETRGVIYKPANGTGPKGGRPGLRVQAIQPEDRAGWG